MSNLPVFTIRQARYAIRHSLAGFFKTAFF
jgi:hypothetical protein